MIPLSPILYRQSKRVRRETPWIAAPPKPWSGTVAGPHSLRLLVLGDSTAVGVGAKTQNEALAGNLARELRARLGRGVEWRAVGRSGDTAAELIRDFLSEATSRSYDFVFLSIGTNDSIGVRSRGSFVRDIGTLVSALRAASKDAPILMSSLPAFRNFHHLPEPLRRTLDRHARSLEAGARAALVDFANVTMSAPPPPYPADFFATDQYHPSAAGYRDWAKFALDSSLASLTVPSARS
jgi:lysophospholipase L1-like esterase